MLNRLRSGAAETDRRGVTLLEIVVALAIMVVIAGAIFLAVGVSSRTGGDAGRIDEAVATLAKLADASVRYSNATTDPEQQSFSQVIGTIATGGVNAGRLSYLTTKITNTDRDSCNTTYSVVEAARWVGPFYPTPIPTTGLKIADGFFANDLMVRYDQAGVPNTTPANVVS
ncbi:MAG: type II secretion system protein, partial [Gemmatimonadaceae bacterium]